MYLQHFELNLYVEWFGLN